MAILISCLIMLALGLPGPLALRRLTDRLTPLETWAYGLPLGAVVGSLALLALALAFGGLSAALVLAVAVISLAVAIWLWPWQTLLRFSREANARGQRLGFAATTSVTSSRRSAAPVEQSGWTKALATFGPLSAIILGIFVVRWALLWAGAFTYDARGLWANQLTLWGDWALHLGDVTAFVYGDNFPPQNTRYAGGPLAYHYLTSITGAAFVELGMNPVAALQLHSFIFCMLLLFGLYAFALRLTADREAAGVSVGLFLLGGSLGWLLIASQINSSHDFLGTLQRQPWDTGPQQDGGFLWQNSFFALIQPQRGYLYGLPLLLLIGTLLYIGIEEYRPRYFVAAGLIAATLPFAHTSTLVALALIAPFVAIFFYEPSRRWFVAWALFFGLWIAVAVPQLYLQQGGQRGETAAIRWQIGWMTTSTHDPWIWFWLKNLGWFIPLLCVALASRTLVAPTARKFLWAFMPTFVICNLIVFRPWDWDNTKFFFYWFLAVCILVAALLTRTWREQRSPLIRFILVSIVLSMTLSGLLVNYQQLAGKDRNVLLSTEELTVAEQVRALTPPHATFATGTQHNHPVPVLAGRRVIMSYTGWLFAFGINYTERQRDVQAIYSLAANTPALLDKYDTDYVVIGPGERREFKPNVEAFRSRYERIINTGNYEIFKVR